MSWSQDISQIAVGADVYGSDGEKVGTVAEVYRDYIIVEKGFFFPTDYYIPLTAIRSADNAQVTLTVTRDEALQSGWDTAPEPSASFAETSGEYATAERSLRGDQPELAGYDVAAADDIVIPVREEELTATVRPQEAGAVRIEKRVVEEDRVLDVPVTEEQVRVERRIVDRPAAAADAAAFEEIVIEVPLTAEQVELQKQARVAEEVVVHKEAVQRTEQVRGTIRREEVEIDEGAISDPSLTERAPDEQPSL